jgi:hypothetical protein
MKKKTILHAGLVSPRLSLEATQEPSEAPHSDDSNDGVSSLFSPSPLLRCWPCCPLSFFLWASAAGEGRGRRHRGKSRGGAGKKKGSGDKFKGENLNIQRSKFNYSHVIHLTSESSM